MSQGGCGRPAASNQRERSGAVSCRGCCCSGGVRRTSATREGSCGSGPLQPLGTLAGRAQRRPRQRRRRGSPTQCPATGGQAETGEDAGPERVHRALSTQRPHPGPHPHASRRTRREHLSQQASESNSGESLGSGGHPHSHTLSRLSRNEAAFCTEASASPQSRKSASTTPGNATRNDSRLLLAWEGWSREQQQGAVAGGSRE